MNSVSSSFTTTSDTVNLVFIEGARNHKIIGDVREREDSVLSKIKYVRNIKGKFFIIRSGSKTIWIH